MNQTAAIICRVSSKEQEDGYSLDAQEHLLRDFSTKRGFDVPLMLRLSETASKHLRRKKFKAFMDEVNRTKIQHIVVEKVDRLTRSGLKEGVMIDDWLETDANRHLHCVKDGIDLHKFSRSGDKLNWGMRVVLAKNYTDNLREEIRKSTDAMLRQGIWPNKTPIGYIRNKANPRSPIQLDPVRAPLIAQMFSLYDTGEWSVQRLSEHLYKEGLRTKMDRQIYSSHIHLMLKDPFYVGKMLFEGKLWEGVHPPIVSHELFDRVQRRINRPNMGVGATLKQRHDHLYRGLVFCSGCGKRLTWEIQKGHTYGYCRQKKSCTERASIREDALDSELLPYLDAFTLTTPKMAEWLRIALKAAHQDERSRHEESREELERLLSKADQRLSRLLDMRIDDSITEQDFDRKKHEISHDKELIIERLSNVSERQMGFMDDISTLISLTQNCAIQFSQASPDRKRTVLRKMFSSVSISPMGTVVEYTELFSNLLDVIQDIKSSKTLFSPQNKIIDFEPEEISSEKEKKDNLDLGHPFWLRMRDEFRTFTNESTNWKKLVTNILCISQKDIDSVFLDFHEL
ncbi:recombinase family protein [Armatimonas rosea]|uniref:DNA invertase Pin-like site-specific DNA recombinase n=1 Tax=Armatimonas rosea TaxID=685828 RepID=A0A7W9W9L1_ARMRO|nr:recombinase family protein [Armatimonas rosea]MBB6053958.1 DNA invertase Pin-like site-specific DNA recombinase [Armatimonas rosea]